MQHKKTESTHSCALHDGDAVPLRCYRWRFVSVRSAIDPAGLGDSDNAAIANGGKNTHAHTLADSPCPDAFGGVKRTGGWAG